MHGLKFNFNNRTKLSFIHKECTKFNYNNLSKLLFMQKEKYQKISQEEIDERMEAAGFDKVSEAKRGFFLF